LPQSESINELNADLFSNEEVVQRAGPVETRKKAMDYLARREYGHRELVDKLKAAGFEHELAAAAVDKLNSEGLQDDRRFIENFLKSRIGQGKGPVRIQTELGQRRLDSGLIDEVLDEAGQDWNALAGEVRRKKFGAAVPGEFREKARQMRFLQYRGFEQPHIQAALAATDDDM